MATIYARISSDRDGSRMGVDRQIADCERWAKEHGVFVAEVYVDNDLSAYSKKPRPDYRRLCDDLRSGLRDGVIVWHLDRLHRSPRELEDFIDLIEDTGAEVRSVTGGDYDLTTPDGRAMARIVGAVARKESEDKSRRLKRKTAEIAQSGRYSGGGTRPYGYTPGFGGVVPEEAAIIKEAAERVLAGESLRAVTNDLNRRRIATVTGVSWVSPIVRKILMSAAVSGQREHKGEIVAKAVWPPILTPTQTLRLRALLSDPARRTNRSPRAYQLTGLLQCGRCAHKMVARPRHGTRRYVCSAEPSTMGCGRIYVVSEPLERLVADAVLYRLDSPELVNALAQQAADPTSDSLELRLIEDRAQLEILATMYGRKELTLREWSAAKSPVQDRIDAADRQLSTTPTRAATAAYIGHSAALREQWRDLHPSRQRAIVATLVDCVRIGPGTTPGRNTFDPDRIEIIWKA